MAPWRYCQYCNYTPTRPEVMLMVWQTQLCCKSCFIKKLEAWNAKLNEIHSQQIAEPENVTQKIGSADTSQGSDGVTYPATPSRPGIHSPQVERLPLQRQGDAAHDSQESRTLRGAHTSAVDTQSQDWPNRKEAEVKSPFTLRSPDTNSGGKK